MALAGSWIVHHKSILFSVKRLSQVSQYGVKMALEVFFYYDHEFSVYGRKFLFHDVKCLKIFTVPVNFSENRPRLCEQRPQTPLRIQFFKSSKVFVIIRYYLMIQEPKLDVLI